MIFAQSHRRILSLLTGAFVAASVPVIAADSGDRIYTYATQGAVPVDLKKGQLPSNSSQTYYLETAIPKSARTTPTPPKAKATPKPKPASTPKPARIRQAQPSKAALVAAESVDKEPAVTVAKKQPSASTPKPAPTVSASAIDDLDDYGGTVKIADPIEPMNRGVFWFNHQLYNYIARPFTKVYRAVLPQPVRNAVHNVYDNIEYPVRMVNHLLQGQPGRADLETRKFVVNSIVGVGGIMKVSDRFPDLSELPSADTGQTFAKWGIGHGPYIVLPVIGPRSARDTVGFAGDMALNPLTWVPIGGVAQAIALPLTTPNTVRNLENRLKVYDAATENAVDPYSAIRGAYIQYRDHTTSK